jgi:hypothetical protein
MAFWIVLIISITVYNIVDRYLDYKKDKGE